MTLICLQIAPEMTYLTSFKQTRQIGFDDFEGPAKTGGSSKIISPALISLAAFKTLT